MSLSEWTGAAVEPGDGPPTPDVWTPVDVPGPAPAFAGNDVVAYRTEFADPRDPDEHWAVLVLRGVYAHARVWLNGEQVATHDSYGRPLRVSFEPAEQNEVIIECRAPEDRFGGLHDTDLVPDTAAVPGIWWGATLETHPATFVRSLEARPRIAEDGAAIDVTATVETAERVDDRLTLSLRGEGDFQSRGMMDRAAVEAVPGEQTVVEHTVDVHDPALWWPRGFGPQHRYAVRTKLGDTERTVTTGLRSVEYGDDGFRVNGERIPARGVNLVTADRDDVRRALEANATFVRAHAQVLPQAVYEACDEAGLLVWQDLPLTGPGAFDPERGGEVARDVADAVGRHPSLAAFGVHDDPADPFPDALGSGLFDRLRLRWRAWRTNYDHGPAEAVAEALPAGYPRFPVIGPPGTDPDAATLYPGWDYGEAADVRTVLDRYPDLGRVVAEFGAGALGEIQPDDEAGFDRATHDARAPDDPEGSQRYQAQVLKTVAEELRRRESHALAAFALRDAGDAGMGVLTSDGVAKAGYDALAASFEPVQATLDDLSPGETPVTVLNDTTEPVTAELAWEAGSADGSFAVEVAAGSQAVVGQVSVPTDAEAATLSLSLPDREVTNTYDLQ